MTKIAFTVKDGDKVIEHGWFDHDNDRDRRGFGFLCGVMFDHGLTVITSPVKED